MVKKLTDEQQLEQLKHELSALKRKYKEQQDELKSYICKYSNARAYYEFENKQNIKNILSDIANIKLDHVDISEMLIAFKITEKIQKIAKQYNIKLEDITND